MDPYGLAGQWVTDALNPSVYTYEVAPVFTLMEAAVLEEMRRLVGFTCGDGMFCPGGSLANGTAMNIARFKMFPDIKVSHSVFETDKFLYMRSVHKVSFPFLPRLLSHFLREATACT